MPFVRNNLALELHELISSPSEKKKGRGKWSDSSNMTVGEDSPKSLRYPAQFQYAATNIQSHLFDKSYFWIYLFMQFILLFLGVN
ncbi:hypothetical protein BofuT4_uP148280.1 [Botrytis cinerea T4]|uniref:Uncharacterized protein n=1 Tax=Botryotinia fuckeliana (strain T4) TaxID=999810 RepID=G2YWY0_BOTF4|nr:hypothetical protein BofuT4_uP148280.1 [Botrytis cinerea T4]